MTPESLIFNQALSWLTVVSNIFIVAIFVSLLTKKSDASRKFLSFIKKYSYSGAFLFSFAGVLGSLIYSNFIGLEPCLLCWVQRIFLYPIAILLFVALVKKEKVMTDYILGLAIPGALVALYHSFTQLGEISLTNCTSIGGSCSVVYFINLGYITIPFMAFTVFITVIALMLVDKLFGN
jgi:disulfide bond formation protein DsbB